GCPARACRRGSVRRSGCLPGCACDPPAGHWLTLRQAILGGLVTPVINFRFASFVGFVLVSPAGPLPRCGGIRTWARVQRRLLWRNLPSKTGSFRVSETSRKSAADCSG